MKLFSVRSLIAFSRCFLVIAIGLLSISSYAQSWSLTGNSGTTGSSWLGTSDFQPIIFKTYNTERLRIDANGNIGIGTPPVSYLKVDILGRLKSSTGYVLGTDFAILPVEHGQSAMTSWWGLQIIGNRQSDVSGTVSPLLNKEDFGVLVPNQQASKTAFAIVGKAGQTGNLTAWLNDSGAVVSRVSSEGHFYTKKLKVTNSPWADYVFDDSYRLPSLQEVDGYIKKHHHLPEIPTADEIAKNGVDVSETQVLLLKKIEELTLYVIQQNEKISKLEKEVLLIQRQTKSQKTFGDK